MNMDKTEDGGVKQKVPMKNASRERMHAELAVLRGQVARLEITKRHLTRNRRRLKSDIATTTATHPLRLREREERDKRRRAELENKRLRRAVSQQLILVKNMVATMEGDVLWLAQYRQPSLANVLHDDNGYRFSALQDDVDRNYAQVDRMIQFDGRHGDKPSSFESILTSHKKGNHESLVLEGRETTVIPFDFEPSHEAMWRAIQESFSKERREAYVYASTANCVQVRLVSVHLERGKAIKRTASVVAKRFIQADRMTVVWRAVASLDGHELDSDAYIDESGWSVMQRVTDGDAAESVVKKIYTQWAPRSFSLYDDHAIAIHPSTSMFTRLAFDSSVDDNTEINELMENLLIDDCMSNGVDEPTAQ